MTKQERDRLDTAVRDVLDRAPSGKGIGRKHLTSYQILHRLPRPMRAALLHEYSGVGKGACVYYSAASAVSKSLVRVGEVTQLGVAYVDTKDLTFVIGKQTVQAGYRVCKLYRLV
jgi:hypothetical protein